MSNIIVLSDDKELVVSTPAIAGHDNLSIPPFVPSLNGNEHGEKTTRLGAASGRLEVAESCVCFSVNLGHTGTGPLPHLARFFHMCPTSSDCECILIMDVGPWPKWGLCTCLL